jgi:hypothetical protein
MSNPCIKLYKKYAISDFFNCEIKMLRPQKQAALYPTLFHKQRTSIGITMTYNLSRPTN